MAGRITAEEADELFRASGLEPLEPYTKRTDERRCRCTTCNTMRFVRLSNLGKPGTHPCRYCYGFRHWGEWAVEARAMAQSWRVIQGPEVALARILSEGLVPITPVGDEFTPVGCVCPCGEALVVMPERVRPERPGWYGCQRCSLQRTRTIKADAERAFAEAGLKLLVPLRGEHTKYPAECLKCGSVRQVRYRDVVAGSAPLCWTCTHGIRMDEPHRVYLFHFPQLRVFKVGITHDRHDVRLIEHKVNGGVLVDTVSVKDRATALNVESWVLGAMVQHRREDVGPEHFPQGGWTEAWSDDVGIDLSEVCRTLEV